MNGRTSSGRPIAGVIGLLLVLFCQSANAEEQQPAASGKSLEARIEALEARVKALEQRIEGSLRTGGPARAAGPLAVDESPITVRLIGKGFLEGDLLAGEVGDRIAIELDFTSRLDKTVRAFTGVVVFRDLFDQEVLRAGLTCAEDLKPHMSLDWSGILGYQPFDEKHRRLRNLGVKDLKTDFFLERLIYSDGSQDVFAESEESKSIQNRLMPAGVAPAAKAKAVEPAGRAAAPQQSITPGVDTEAGSAAP
jgi:hypothetical protein